MNVITAKVTNNSQALQGVRSIAGVVYLPQGKTRKLEFLPHELERAKTRTFLSVEEQGTANLAPAEVLGRVEPQAFTGLVAKHRGGGSYSIVDANGTELAEKLSKEDAETFNGLSDEDKSAYVSRSKEV